MPDLTENPPQNEVILANLRNQAINSLVNEGIESSYTSQTKRTAQGLEVNTTNDKTKQASAMIVNGTTSVDDGWFTDTINGDFTITHLDAQRKPASVEKDKFERSINVWDDIWDRPDKYNQKITRADANGNPFQTYNPAISEGQYKGRQPILDPNGQTVRLARMAGSDPNCGRENIYNPDNKRFECDYIINNKTSGGADKQFSYNETREKAPAGIYHRSVLRDMQGNVLGIVYQNFNINQNGDLVDVRTSARKPDQLKK